MVRVHKKRKEVVRDYILLIAGTGLIALSVQAVFDPMGMVTGGFTGIGILLRRATLGLIPGGIPLWFTNLALNLPAFVAAWFLMGKVFVKRTAIAAGLLSAWLAVIPVMDLAKGGDIIRGRTFSPFMPLIAVALIYLVMVVFFTWLVSRLERRLRNSEH